MNMHWGYPPMHIQEEGKGDTIDLAQKGKRQIEKSIAIPYGEIERLCKEWLSKCS